MQHRAFGVHAVVLEHLEHALCRAFEGARQVLADRHLAADGLGEHVVRVQHHVPQSGAQWCGEHLAQGLLGGRVVRPHGLIGDLELQLLGLQLLPQPHVLGQCLGHVPGWGVAAGGVVLGGDDAAGVDHHGVQEGHVAHPDLHQVPTLVEGGLLSHGVIHRDLGDLLQLLGRQRAANLVSQLTDGRGVCEESGAGLAGQGDIPLAHEDQFARPTLDHGGRQPVLRSLRQQGRGGGVHLRRGCRHQVLAFIVGKQHLTGFQVGDLRGQAPQLPVLRRLLHLGQVHRGGRRAGLNHHWFVRTGKRCGGDVIMGALGKNHRASDDGGGDHEERHHREEPAAERGLLLSFQNLNPDNVWAAGACCW